MIENKPEIISEQSIPEAAPALADWIEGELGDDELAQFLRDHSEGAELISNGERLLPRTVFDLADDLIAYDPEKGERFLERLSQDGLLPELSSEHIALGVSEEEKEKLVLAYRQCVAKATLGLHANERSKTGVEGLMWQRALEAVNALRVRHGVPPITPSPDALHIVAHRFKREHPGEGVLIPDMQQILVAMEESDASRYKIIFHELTHLASFLALYLEKNTDARPPASTAQIGLATARNNHREGGRQLNDLNEAVTEELAKRFLESLPEDDPELGELARARRERIVRYIEEHSPRNPHSLLMNDIADIHTLPNGKDYPSYFTYGSQRQRMYQLFNKFSQRNPEHFMGKTEEESREELFEMLQKAMFTGNILPFGRLFNETFGNGKFREFGHLQTTEEQQAFIEGL